MKSRELKKLERARAGWLTSPAFIATARAMLWWKVDRRGTRTFRGMVQGSSRRTVDSPKTFAGSAAQHTCSLRLKHLRIYLTLFPCSCSPSLLCGCVFRPFSYISFGIEMIKSRQRGGEREGETSTVLLLNDLAVICRLYRSRMYILDYIPWK